MDVVKKSPFDLIEPGDPNIRQRILDLQELLVSLPEELKMEVPHQDHFSHKVYGRSMTIPQGCLIIGKIHRNRTLNIICNGEVSVLTDDGVDHYEGPCIFVSKPGAKRVVYSHVDTLWVTAHGTEETDMVKVEDEIIAKSYDELPTILDGELVKTLEG